MTMNLSAITRTCGLLSSPSLCFADRWFDILLEQFAINCCLNFVWIEAILHVVRTNYRNNDIKLTIPMIAALSIVGLGYHQTISLYSLPSIMAE